MDLQRHFRVMSILVALGVILAPLSTRADVVLKVHPAQTESVSFTMEQLRRYPRVVIETTTPWTDGEQRFVGVALSNLLGDMTPSDSISLRALNDYVVSMPASEVASEVPVVAYERNGKAMTVRNKGPLWLIYPFDSDAEYRTETVFSRSIWQLFEITVSD